jgi:hypothetical protein
MLAVLAGGKQPLPPPHRRTSSPGRDSPEIPTALCNIHKCPLAACRRIAASCLSTATCSRQGALRNGRVGVLGQSISAEHHRRDANRVEELETPPVRSSTFLSRVPCVLCGSEHLAPSSAGTRSLEGQTSEVCADFGSLVRQETPLSTSCGGGKPGVARLGMRSRRGVSPYAPTGAAEQRPDLTGLARAQAKLSLAKLERSGYY